MVRSEQVYVERLEVLKRASEVLAKARKELKQVLAESRNGFTPWPCDAKDCGWVQEGTDGEKLELLESLMPDLSEWGLQMLSDEARAWEDQEQERERAQEV